MYYIYIIYIIYYIYIWKKKIHVPSHQPVLIYVNMTKFLLSGQRIMKHVAQIY